MLNEVFDLDLANTGLGGLDEVSFLRLFATTQSREIVRGTGRTLRDIENSDGVQLYPAFYRTRVTVPPPLLFDRYRLWDRVEIGVDLRRFGSMLLESTGVLAAPGNIGPDPAEWQLDRHVHVTGSMLFVHDKSRGTPDSPRQGTVANLPLLQKRPEALDEQRRIRSEGVMAVPPEGRPKLSGRMRYPILLMRDVQAGQALMFSAFTSLLEVAEQILLLEQVWPPFDPSLLSFRHLLERDIHYVDNVHQGDTVVIDTVATLSASPAHLATAYDGLAPVAMLDLQSEIYQEGTHKLVVAARTRKLFAVPRSRATDAHDLRRMLHRHGGLP